MKRAALYMRVSSVDQHPETQLYDLRQMAAQRGLEIVNEYTNRISGARAAILRDRQRGNSLGQLARSYNASRATIHRVLHEDAAKPQT